jgi:hypothetical protein
MTASTYVRRSEAKKRGRGLKEIRVWVPDDPDSIKAIRAMAALLCDKVPTNPEKDEVD